MYRSSCVLLGSSYRMWKFCCEKVRTWRPNRANCATAFCLPAVPPTFALPSTATINKSLYNILPIINFPMMSAMARQAKLAHALVHAIRHAHTQWHKGEAIHREKWYLDLSLEPTPPEKDNIRRDIRSSGLGEVLLDIVVQGAEGGPIDVSQECVYGTVDSNYSTSC